MKKILKAPRRSATLFGILLRLKMFCGVRMNEAESVRQVILKIVCSLVDSPDCVTVDAVIEDRSIQFEVRVVENDLGKVIGKQGRTARSIRTILEAASHKSNRRMGVDFVKLGG